jgi:hypothetical protein
MLKLPETGMLETQERDSIDKSSVLPYLHNIASVKNMGRESSICE